MKGIDCLVISFASWIIFKFIFILFLTYCKHSLTCINECNNIFLLSCLMCPVKSVLYMLTFYFITRFYNKKQKIFVVCSGNHEYEKCCSTNFFILITNQMKISCTLQFQPKWNVCNFDYYLKITTMFYKLFLSFI